jgi:hypothetical protein
MIGGLSNPRGCVLGGFLLGMLESLVNLWSGSVARGRDLRAGDPGAGRFGRPACSARG